MSECDEYLFFDQIQIPKIIWLFGFQKSLNAEYQIVFDIEKIQILNTKYYSALRKPEYRIPLVLFGLTIQIPNTKYQIE